ncbi:MAG TPA: polysaccharide deacetylase family protein [Thermoleophilaceae bacterium]|jgi:peptidoglycan/xylan/chitin deacetylase (PgdA/CDA1 family)|nr:polysaccharide deacetylase family protein [Thermoleophilaceae bacterium]
MPSFLEHREMLQLWAELPGLERIEHGAALTFDDGPDPDATPEVLDALDAAQIHATFFLVGEQVEAHPKLAQEIAQGGHDVQAHCFDHTHHQDVTDPAHDLWQTIEAIFKATGVAPTMQRPPYGRFTPASHEACLQAGLEPIYWSAWGEDWEDLAPDRITDFVTRDLSDGVVILLHDSARYAHRPSARATAAAIPAIAAAMAERGLIGRPISAARA